MEQYSQIKEKSKENRILDNLLITEIDKLYNIMNYEPKYYIIQRFITFFISLTVMSSIFFFILFSSYPKNNFYCFNKYISQFKICDSLKHCNNVKKNIVNNIFYIDFNDEIIKNITSSEKEQSYEQLYILNKYFKSFIFNYYVNKTSLNVNTNTMVYKDYTSMIIYIKQYDSFMIDSHFYLICLFEKFEIYLLCFNTFSLVASCFIGTYYADLFGRKKVLSFSLFKLILGLLGIYLFTMMIKENVESFEEFNQNTYNLLKGFEYIRQDFIEKALHSYFIYQSYKVRSIQFFFMKYKIFYLISYSFIISGGVLSIICLSALMVESSINTNVLFAFQKFRNGGYIFSIVLIILISKLNMMFINCVLMLMIMGIISMLLCIFKLKESIRFYYEYRNYDLIQEVLIEIMTASKYNKIFKGLFNSQKTNMLRYASEIEMIYETNNKITILKYFSFLFSSKLHFGYINFLKNRLSSLSLKNIVQYPYILLYLSIKNRLINKKKVLFYIILISNFFSFFISLSMLFSNLMINQVNMSFYNIKDMTIFLHIASPLLFIGLGSFFTFLYNILGDKYLIIICNVFSIILSSLFIYFQETLRFGFDRNLYFFNSKDLLYVNNRIGLLIIFVLNINFNACSLTSLFLNYTQYTYTIHRCTSYGIMFFLYFLICNICKITVNVYENYSLIIHIVFNIISIFNSFLLVSKDSKTIRDYRNIIINDDN